MKIWKLYRKGVENFKENLYFYSQASLRMFHDLGLVTKFSLDHNTLCHWVLTIKKNYRSKVPYHNWRHAFSVAQMMFIFLLQSGWDRNLDPVRCLGLLVACFSHDLDHRGLPREKLKHQIKRSFRNQQQFSKGLRISTIPVVFFLHTRETPP